MCDRPLLIAMAVLLGVCITAQARATPPPPEANEARAEPPKEDGPDPNRLEVGVLPALAYDSDLGFGFGGTVSLAKFRPGYHPYNWRLRSLIYMTIKESPEGGVELPWHDDWVALDLPGLADGALRLELKVGFKRYTTASYHGFGNRVVLDAKAVADNPRYYQYRLTNPYVSGQGRITLGGDEMSRLDLLAGVQFTYNALDPYADGKLVADLRGDNGALAQRLLVGAQDHGTVHAVVGLVWDTRDHETAPTGGMRHDVSLRGGAGLGEAFGYGKLNLTARLYQGIWSHHLVAAMRLQSDLLFGRPPFYEAGTGGATSLRGVPSGRYRGKIKVLANAELRARLFPFRIGRERFVVRALGFVDAGRVWADYESHPALDGDGLGLKVGMGGGLRFQWGEAFMIRTDVAYSPTEDNVGLYIDIDHIF